MNIVAMTVRETRWHQTIEGLAQHGCCRAAKHLFGSRIEQNNFVLGVHTDDGIHRVIDHVFQTVLAALQGAQRDFLLGDVLKNAGELGGLTIRK